MKGSPMNGSPMRNRTRHRLAAGQLALGSFAFLSDPASVEAIGQAGLDFAIIDMEHTDRDMSGVLPMIRGADATGITPLVRVPALDDKQILRALEAGAHGILVPSVGSAAQARTLRLACRYPPDGVRGTCRFSRASGLGANAADWPAFVARANAEVLAVALVEDPAGAAEIEQIVSEVDLVLVGRGDLSTALGVPGQVDHPDVMAIVERYERAARQHGQPLATMCYSAADAARWVDRGYQLLIYAADVNILFRAYADFRAALPPGAGDG